VWVNEGVIEEVLGWWQAASRALSFSDVRVLPLVREKLPICDTARVMCSVSTSSQVDPVQFELPVDKTNQKVDLISPLRATVWLESC